MENSIIFISIVFSFYYVSKLFFKNKSCSKNCTKCKTKNKIEIINKNKKEVEKL